MKILYVTDLHGDKNKYRKSLEIAMKQEIRVIVNGGDMLPKLGERHTEQPLFIKGFLSNYFSILQEHNITYLNMLGNDDLLSVDNLFEQTCGGFANVHNIAGKKIRIDEYEFIGMNQILDHPFGCKDRVVTETDYIPQRQLSFFAGISNEYGYDRIFDWLEYSKTELPLMCGILKELPEPESPKKTVYVMHMPPAGLRLSKAFRSVVEQSERSAATSCASRSFVIGTSDWRSQSAGTCSASVKRRKTVTLKLALPCSI